MLTHGGDRVGFLETYGQEPIDFSVNTNPFGMPPKAKKAAAQALERAVEYPDMRYRRLCKAIGEHYRVPAEFVIPGNGAADLIWRVAAIKKGEQALITAPTFSEYEAALSANGCEVRRHILLRESGFAVTEDILDEITPDLGVLILCNPNNPTGKTVERELLLKILERCQVCGVLLCVDECFNDFLDDPNGNSLRDQLSRYDDLVIFGALTKIYAIAGLRMGFALCADRGLREQLWTAGQSWPVSIVAEEAAIAAMEEKEYLRESLSLVHSERQRMKEALEAESFEVIGGEANYLFFYTDIPAFDRLLGEKGFLIRNCAGYPGLCEGYYRIAVRLPEDNDRLIAACSAAAPYRRCPTAP